MKVGDIALKISGHHAGKIGIILHIETTARGYTKVRVLSDGLIRHWNINFVEVLYESG